MKTSDPNIKWIEEPQLGLAGRLYVPLFVQGLTTTFKHLKNSLIGDVVTVSVPAPLRTEEHPLAAVYEYWPASSIASCASSRKPRAAASRSDA